MRIEIDREKGIELVEDAAAAHLKQRELENRRGSRLSMFFDRQSPAADAQALENSSFKPKNR